MSTKKKKTKSKKVSNRNFQRRRGGQSRQMPKYKVAATQFDAEDTGTVMDYELGMAFTASRMLQ